MGRMAGEFPAGTKIKPALKKPVLFLVAGGGATDQSAGLLYPENHNIHLMVN